MLNPYSELLALCDSSFTLIQCSSAILRGMGCVFNLLIISDPSHGVDTCHGLSWWHSDPMEKNKLPLRISLQRSHCLCVKAVHDCVDVCVCVCRGKRKWALVLPQGFQVQELVIVSLCWFNSLYCHTTEQIIINRLVLTIALLHLPLSHTWLLSGQGTQRLV